MLVDLVALVVIGGFAYTGYVMGLAKHAWLVAAALLAVLLSGPVFGIAQGILGMSDPGNIATGLALQAAVAFGLFLVLMYFGSLAAQSMIEDGKVMSENQGLGALVGAGQGFMSATVVLWVVAYVFLKLASDQDLFVQKQLEQSAMVKVTDRFNPLNLLTLRKITPYLPADLNGSKHGQQRPPMEIARNENFQTLLMDDRFKNAYREKRYMAILRNRAFQKFAGDRELIDTLDKVAHQTEEDAFEWKDSAR